MAHAVNQPAAIGGLPPEDLLQVGFHLPFVLPVSHVGHQVVHHPPYLVVGAAVFKALQGAHRGANGGIDVRPGAGEHPGGEGGVVAAAVLCVEHHAQVQKPGLFMSELPVRAQRVQNGLRCGMPRLVRMEKHTLLIKVPPLHLVGIGHDGGHPGNQGNALPHIVLQRLVIRVVIVRVQRQHRAGQLVHNVLGGRLDDHVFGEIFGQLPVFKQ